MRNTLGSWSIKPCACHTALQLFKAGTRLLCSIAWAILSELEIVVNDKPTFLITMNGFQEATSIKSFQTKGQLNMRWEDTLRTKGKHTAYPNYFSMDVSKAVQEGWPIAAVYQNSLGSNSTKSPVTYRDQAPKFVTARWFCGVFQSTRSWSQELLGKFQLSFAITEENSSWKVTWKYEL